MPRKRQSSRRADSAGATAMDRPQDTRKVVGAASPDSGDPEAAEGISKQWTTLRKQMLRDFRSQPISEVHDSGAKRGTLYRWGLAAATGTEVPESVQWLSRLACAAPISGKRLGAVDLDLEIRKLQESLVQHAAGLDRSATAVVWAAAMPALLREMEENQWWSLLGMLQEYREGKLNHQPSDPETLLVVAELGLTLAWRLRALPSCRRLAKSSLDALARWAEQDDLSVSSAVGSPQDMRLILASVLRCKSMLERVALEPVSGKGKAARKGGGSSRRRLMESLQSIGVELTTWVASTTRTDGRHAFTSLGKKAFADDRGKHGLLASASRLDEDSLGPALRAALGESSGGGRLAWQVCLPETLMHEEDARFASLLPEWDARRGRMVVSYDEPVMQMEWLAGKTPLVSGRCETEIRVGRKTLVPEGEWISTCEYTDDDVHYLEWEQPHNGGYVLQRQLMLVREDRCCYFADAVLQTGVTATRESESPPNVEYQLRLPLADQIEVRPEEETNELLLAGSRAEALVLPLAAPEWRTARSAMRIEGTEDQHLLVTASGSAGLYVPLWVDLNRGRIHRERTWRCLTVAEQLSIVPPQRACAFRIQIGKRQWVLYRSLSDSVPRTFFGKHMIADFYSARFDSDQQNYEDLITVEDQPS